MLTPEPRGLASSWKRLVQTARVPPVGCAMICPGDFWIKKRGSFPHTSHSDTHTLTRHIHASTYTTFHIPSPQTHTAYIRIDKHSTHTLHTDVPHTYYIYTQTFHTYHVHTTHHTHKPYTYPQVHTLHTHYTQTHNTHMTCTHKHTTCTTYIPRITYTYHV